jgi:enoyl-CoA hydratase/carnithine racemase
MDIFEMSKVWTSVWISMDWSSGTRKAVRANVPGGHERSKSQWDQLDAMIKTCKISDTRALLPKPVVAAPAGMALGGGRVMMSASQRVCRAASWWRLEWV